MDAITAERGHENPAIQALVARSESTNDSALLQRAVAVQQAMLNAGGELARVHGRLSDIAEEMTIGTDPCPTPAFGLDAEAPAEAIAA